MLIQSYHRRLKGICRYSDQSHEPEHWRLLDDCRLAEILCFMLVGGRNDRRGKKLTLKLYGNDPPCCGSQTTFDNGPMDEIHSTSVDSPSLKNERGGSNLISG